MQIKDEFYDGDHINELKKAKNEMEDSLATYRVVTDKEIEWRSQQDSVQERKTNGWRVLIGSIVNVACAGYVTLYIWNHGNETSQAQTQTNLLTFITTLGPFLLALYFLISAVW